MDNLRAVIKNLFCNISAQDIAQGNIRYNAIDKDTFQQLGSGYILRYSNDELENMYYFLKNEFKWQNWKLKCEAPSVKEDGVWNVFDALFTFDEAVLAEENGVPVCQYTQLLRWREMTTVLEEDLFVTSYLAFNDLMYARQRENFFWKPVIGHNNKTLNSLLAQGVAENHFHLKGSAPQFQLSWMSLMNRVNEPDFIRTFDTYDKNRLQKNISYSQGYACNKLKTLWRQAALVRVFLFQELMRAEKVLTKEYCCDNRILDYKLVGALLADEKELEDSAGWLQACVNYYCEELGKSPLDYIICYPWLNDSDGHITNSPLGGERWFLYSVFKKIYAANTGWHQNFNYFYLYLVLKACIRRELVQANTNVGFDNFAQYQDRKDVFVENSIYEEVYIRMAVRDTILNQHIVSLEARITPKNDLDSMIHTIQKYDGWITKGLKDEEAGDLKNRYFYVVHFPKKSERFHETSDCLEEYRHYELRKQIEKQSRILTELKNRQCEAARRIKGIDACASEIWCRPEVFAQAFRYLKNYVPEEALKISPDHANTMLRATYHVGEDFLDIVDGLRAIDEAISFLNLRCGDRLGHALALGVDIDDWYRSKAHRILINKMSFIDNLSWVYAKLRQYDIQECEDAKTYIEKRFDEYFTEIYKNNLSSAKQEEIIHNAQKYYAERAIAHSYDHNNFHISINDYYDSWKLRGDNPLLYRNGFFQLTNCNLDDWDRYAVNREFPTNYKIRYVPEVAMLYYEYQYNPKVKITGDQVVEVRVEDCMIKAVKLIRKKMQQEICSRGLAIETNPSSNYLIGTFRRYDRHPIVNWYNYGLTCNQEEVENCPQLQVSINTDDQGVFTTYIENEYAYLALALEKYKDENGKYRYNKTMILQWLDNIRKMGINQSFR